MKRLVKIATMLMIGIIIIFSSKVNATSSDSYKAGISVNKSTIVQGDDIEVVMSLKDLNVTTGDKGLGAYQATLEYDKSIFEYVGIKGLNSWDTPIYNDGTFATTTSTGEAIKKAEEVAKITLKAKTNLTQGETTIKLTNITASTGTNTVATANVSKTIKVGQGQNNNQNNTENNNGSNNGSSQNTKTDTTNNKGTSQSSNKETSTGTSKSTGTSAKNNKSNATKDTTAQNKILPKTGKSHIIGISMIATILLIILGNIVVYVRKK